MSTNNKTTGLPSLIEMDKLFEHIDADKGRHIETLREAVAIKSVSAWPNSRPEISKMIDWTVAKLKALGTTIELVDLGEETLLDGTKIPLPNAILGQLGNDPSKRTVCIYCHLDVQPALLSDGWDSEPFVLTEKDGKLYGRGAADDKGPLVCWLHAIEGYQALSIPLPVNIKFVLEGMEEVGSKGLAKQLLARKQSFFKGIDYVCVTDSSWLTKSRPCITYGIRGICYFAVEVQCAKKDLHSGTNGGAVLEAMADLMYLLDSLVDKDGHILIDDIYQEVAPLLTDEEKIYEAIHFDIDEFRNDIGAYRLAQGEQKVPLLMANWRYPSLSIHGIEGATHEQGHKTVIPHKVTGKFSIRIVPNQTIEQVERVVLAHLNAKWAERESPNTFNVSVINRSDSWTEDPNHPHYEAAKRAVKHVFKKDADLTRAGGSVPITLTLKQVTDANVLMLPTRAPDDGAHSQNEKLNIDNFIKSTKLFAMYLYEVGSLN